MNVQNATCPPDSVLGDFGLGRLDGAHAEQVGRHLQTCPNCRHRAAGLSGQSLAGRLPRAEGAAVATSRRERTYVPGESIVNASGSTPGSWGGVQPEPVRAPEKAAAGSIVAPPELANHPDYELIKELGQGGMGTVYLAKNRMMDRLEVLKVISKSLLDRPGSLERFQQEIRSAAKLAHSNIVAAYSVLRPGELLVFAMEYVRGQDLSQVVKQRGPLPVTNAAFYIHQVANGLQHALEKGMVHRDIKPNNLMLAVEGKKHVVKILDFGLAKASSEKGAESGLTKSGQMLGTPDYVAPEQTLDAQKADIRADIYSLGCTLYFLLSGGPPFQETSLFEILQAHHTRDPKPLNPLRPEVPVQLDAVVAKMMAKNPADRYQTPVEVARALVPFFKAGEALPPLASVQAKRPQIPGDTVSGIGETTLIPPAAQPLASTAVTPIPLAPTAPVRLDPAVPVMIATADSGSPRSVRRRQRGASPMVLAGLGVGVVGLAVVMFMAFQKSTPEPIPSGPGRPKTGRVAESEPKPRTPPKLPEQVASLVPPPPTVSPSVPEQAPPLPRVPEQTPVATVDNPTPPVDNSTPPAATVPVEPSVKTLAPLVEPKIEDPPETKSTQPVGSGKPPGSAMQKGGNPKGRKGAPAPGSTWYLCELPLQAYFVFVPEKTVIPGIVPGFKFPSGAALSLKGDPTPHGLYTPPPANGFSFLNFKLAGKAKSISFEVGLDKGSPRVIATKPVFQVWGDNRLLWASSAITGTEYTEKCENLDVEGVRILVLRVNCPGRKEGVEPVWYEPTITWK